MFLATYMMIENLKHMAVTRIRDRGASATEYALIMGFIVAGLITVMVVFGPRIVDQFQKACEHINGTAGKC